MEEVKSGFFSALTKKKGVRKYPKNRKGMRQAMHDSASLVGHTRKSAASAKVHTPSPQELIEWSEWKAEQKAKRKVKHCKDCRCVTSKGFCKQLEKHVSLDNPACGYFLDASWMQVN